MDGVSTWTAKISALPFVQNNIVKDTFSGVMFVQTRSSRRVQKSFIIGKITLSTPSDHIALPLSDSTGWGRCRKSLLRRGQIQIEKGLYKEVQAHLQSWSSNKHSVSSNVQTSVGKLGVWKHNADTHFIATIFNATDGHKINILECE